MKKVAVLVTRLYMGGVVRVMVELLKRLERVDDLEFTIYTTRIKSDWHRELDSEVRKFSPLPYPELAYRRPDVIRELSKFDLIWNHNLYLNKLATKIDVPIISTFHPPHSKFPGWFSSSVPVKDRLDRFLNEEGLKYLQYTDRVVAISEQNKDRLSEIHKAKPVRIYNGGDSEYSEFSEKDENFVFCTDHLDETVERAAKRVEMRGLGEGKSKQIDYLGRLSNEELHDYYSRCSFVVVGSGMEGFGISPVEAAFHGKPSVVRAVGGHKETVVHGETGFLAENSKEFHKYIDLLWNDEELRKEMGKNAFEHVKENFSWKKAAEEYLAEFNDLLGSELNY